MKFIRIALLVINSFLFVTCTQNVTGNSSKNEVTDIDGNVYKTVTIGTQVWMAENLKTTRFNDGSPIPLVTDSAAWGNLATPGYCWYNDSATYGSTYGALYNWYAVNTGKLAPKGWHVPSDSEWTILMTVLGGDSVAGGAMKSIGTTYWRPPNTGANNLSGFSALPGGCCNSNGTFDYLGNFSCWWSFTAAYGGTSWYRGILFDFASVNRNNYGNVCGFGIRCVRD